MAVDYDAPRVRQADDAADENELASLRRMATKTIDGLTGDEANAEEAFELPGADLSDEELEVLVVPKRADEFTCSRCFLVYHRSRLARKKGTTQICRDCI